MENHEKTLTESISDAKMEFERLQALLSEKEAEMKREEILKKHTTPITFLEGRGRWTTRVNGKQKTLKSRKELEDWIVSQYSETATAKTLDDIAEAWFSIDEKRSTDRTLVKHRGWYERFLKNSPLFTKNIQDITIDDGYEWVSYCLSIYPHMTRKYFTNVRSVLNGIMQYAIDKRLLTYNPIANMKLRKDVFCIPDKTREEDTVFSTVERTSVCKFSMNEAEATGEAKYYAIALLFELPLRDGELCALTWGNIIKDIKGNSKLVIERQLVTDCTSGKAKGYRIVNYGKTRAAYREITLSERAIQILARVKDLNTQKGYPITQSDFIFMRSYNGIVCGCTQRCFDSYLRRYCKKAGMPVIKSPHDVRRTVCTNLYLNGMPPKRIQTVMGHETLEQTLEYIRSTNDDLEDSQFFNLLNQAAPDNVIPMKTKVG